MHFLVIEGLYYKDLKNIYIPATHWEFLCLYPFEYVNLMEYGRVSKYC